MVAGRGEDGDNSQSTPDQVTSPLSLLVQEVIVAYEVASTAGTTSLKEPQVLGL